MLRPVKSGMSDKIYQHFWKYEASCPEASLIWTDVWVRTFSNVAHHVSRETEEQLWEAHVKGPFHIRNIEWTQV
jgi:hypothetical protein